MKKILSGFLFFYTLANLTLCAQPVLTASGLNPQIGEKSNWQTAKDIPFNLSNFYGQNLTWDFTNLVDSGPVNVYSILPTTGQPYKDSFPNSNLCLLLSLDSNLVEYFNTSSASWGVDGIYYKNFFNNVNYSSLVRYTPSLKFLVFPMTLGTVYTDSIKYKSISVANTFAPYNASQKDTLIGIGYGTLKLPTGIYNNVLCIYRGQSNGTINISFSSNGYHVSLLSLNQANDALGKPIKNFWTVGYYSGIALPLEITSFNTTWKEGKPYLNWNAVNTENTKTFYVQRSTDGIAFHTIGEVGVHTSSAYSFKDNASPSSVVYYRIQQVDKNGKLFYSKITSLKPTEAPLAFNVFPNPAKDLATITFNKPVDKGTVSVVDIVGKVVISGSFEGIVNSYRLNSNLLGSGIYSILVKSGAGSFQQKLLINK